MYKIAKFVQINMPANRWTDTQTLMQTLALSEFRANASAMIDLVEKGETVRILRHGKLVAEVVPIKAEQATKVPRWKLPIEPLHMTRSDGKTGAQLIIEERESGW